MSAFDLLIVSGLFIGITTGSYLILNVAVILCVLLLLSLIVGASITTFIIPEIYTKKVYPVLFRKQFEAKQKQMNLENELKVKRNVDFWKTINESNEKSK